MEDKKKDELDLEEEEKEFLLDLIKMQNETLKRIYKKTIENEKEK
ncbi:hypothetical protein [Bacillus sp. FJAT-29814]|nr:hypothetical protein [Bacillus sp. FJAT-29814]